MNLGSRVETVRSMRTALFLISVSGGIGIGVSFFSSSLSSFFTSDFFSSGFISTSGMVVGRERSDASRLTKVEISGSKPTCIKITSTLDCLDSSVVERLILCVAVFEPPSELFL